jgi:hypothetical protein
MIVCGIPLKSDKSLERREGEREREREREREKFPQVSVEIGVSITTTDNMKTELKTNSI